MLHMGNGDHSAAACFERVTELLDLFTELSGVQQLGIGPQPDSEYEIKQAWSEFDIRAKRFLKQLSNDFNITK